MPVSNIHNKDKTTIYYGGTDKSNMTGRSEEAGSDDEQSGENNEKGKTGDAIYAGDLNLCQDDIALKKIEARKNAIKVILSAFTGDMETDEILNERAQHANELQREKKQAQDEINKINDQKQEIKEAYGIADDSEEQKNLELLEKQSRIACGSAETLSEEEKERLNNMGPLTEYQQAALEYDGMENYWRGLTDDAEKELINENRTISAIKIERLKSHAMADANKEAQDIIRSAGKEIIGMLMDNVKDKVDEQTEEANEKIEEKEEKEKEEKEKAQQKENAKNKEISAVDSSTGPRRLLEADPEFNKLLNELKNMIQNQKMLGEDIKGVEVNKEV